MITCASNEGRIFCLHLFDNCMLIECINPSYFYIHMYVLTICCYSLLESINARVPLFANKITLYTLAIILYNIKHPHEMHEILCQNIISLINA